MSYCLKPKIREKKMSEIKNAKEENKYGKYDSWEIESAARTLIEAEQIKLDKNKMKYILPLLEKQKKALDNVKTVAEVLYGKDE